MSTSQAYAVYYTSATGEYAAGYVFDRSMWDGTSAWSPPAGSAAVADPDSKYPIGSTYSAS
ncbi:hypothetical protein [Acetobacter nitrogenifigens]|uniref:hypothetical protein n=1 Tax=Acetobacter nitrogenifigens TaxID=285268 RepID=UPI0011BE65D6|nr:hypothetical protein [Acetobacter nitrogenifigens]